MSGAQWSPEELANALEESEATTGWPGYGQAAAYLRTLSAEAERLHEALERISLTPDPRYQRDSWGTVAGHLSGVLMVAREALAAHTVRTEKE